MRRVVVVAFDGVQSLDLVGPVEVFRTATQNVRGGYAIELRAPGLDFVTSSGLSMRAQRELRARAPRDLDTLVVCGGDGTRDVLEDATFLRHVRRLAGRARRVASVCSGAFLLAEAGLLAGKRATTHWAWCEALAERHEDVEVDPDAIFVRDGRVWTSAGVTAGMDLALALVEEDHGREVALKVAQQLVLYVQRPGGQSQFSRALRVQAETSPPIERLRSWIAEHIDADLRVEVLAAEVGMSERHFRRLFRQQLGVAPARYVEDVRLEVARRLLETTALDLTGIAVASGLGTERSLGRVFRRRLGVAPSVYRARFRRSAA
ncbi:MAG: GlxA family transcriptional regulator [Myxococcota bacterium]